MADQKQINFTGTGFQFLGWGLFATILSIFIIPAAWGAAELYRWFVRNLEFSDGTKASFEGRGGQVWFYFLLVTLLGLVPQLSRAIDDPTGALVVSIVLPFLLLPVTAVLWLKILHWFFDNISLSSGTKLNFKGSYGPYLGWMVLISFSVYTIIGWAWVATALLRWICRNLEAGSKQIEFFGSGWGLLWRCLVATLASIVIIPIPWVWLWVVKWVIQNMLIREKLA